MIEQHQKAEMPIDLCSKHKKLNVVSLKTNRQYYDEPFFLDSLALKYNIQLKPKDAIESKALVRSLDYSHSLNLIDHIQFSDFVSESEKAPEQKKLFIFHISRCGSTLITQMLSRSRKFFVVSEPPFINTVLNPKKNFSQSELKSLLKAGIKSISNCAPKNSELTVIKFRSWNTLFLKTIIELFPSVPWMFVHRNGAEVLASVLQDPPGWLRAQHNYSGFFAQHLNLDENQLVSFNPPEFVARLLNSFCTIAFENKADNCFFVDYKSLPLSVIDIIENSLEIKLSPSEKDQVLLASHFYSKDVARSKTFKDDSQEKIKILSNEDLNMIQSLMETQRNKLFI